MSIDSTKITNFINAVKGLISTHNSDSSAHSNIIPKIFYGTCTTSASAQVKEITTSSNYILDTGTILIVKFTNGQTYNSSSTNTLQLKINNNANINVEYVVGQKGIRYHWAAGEIVQFVYDGSNFVMIDEGAATTTYWGVTKLYDGVDSTSTGIAATPNSVKIAYDLANGRENPNNKVTSWSNTTTDTNYPSEKLVKDSLDEKQNTLVSGTNIKTINNNSLVGSGNVSLTIPSSSSDLTDGSSLVKTSNTSGLLKNNGEVMASGTGASNWAVGNHTHSTYMPKPVTLDTSTDNVDNLIDNGYYVLNENIAISGTLPISNKAFTLMVDGDDKTVRQILTYYKAQNRTFVRMYSGWDVNLGWSAWKELATTDLIVNDLTTGGTTSVLSAEQGKVLANLIGDAISYINQ